MARDMSPMVKAQMASTKPIVDSEAGTRSARSSQDMVIHLLVLGRFQASLLALGREVVREVRRGEQRVLTHPVTRNRRATTGGSCPGVVSRQQIALSGGGVSFL